MRFSELTAASEPRQMLGPVDVVVSDLTDDSRSVTPGCCFIARRTPDNKWESYVREAIQRGAAAVVLPEPVTLPQEVAAAVLERVDQRTAGQLAARFFDHPADRLGLVGVTGTNGKTTVATLTQHLLNHADLKCGLIGTVALDTGHPDGSRPAELTTPGAIELQRLLAEMVAHGCKACAMEVSSHALDQGRVEGLRFDAAVYTNLTQDHLDYHKTMEAYAAAKASLFTQLSRTATAVINADDDYADAMVRESEAKRVWTSVLGIGLSADDRPLSISAGRHQDELELLAARVLEANHDGCRVMLCHGEAESEVAVPLVGIHNVSNWLQAVAAAVAVGANWKDAVEAFNALKPVPGRLEPVRIDGVDGPMVVVDYAHTPDALENVLAALRPLTQGTLTCVFGCGGDRDRTKRPQMARVAVDLSDRAVLTSDNPRTEDPQRILDDAAAGVPVERRDRLLIEIDRAAAIRAAIRDASPSDLVLIAGKGHEDYQIIADPSAPDGKRKIHFDDREHAAAALQSRGERQA